MAEHWVRTSEVARELGVAPSTVRQIPPEQLPYIAVGRRGTRRYARADVFELLDARYVDSELLARKLTVPRGPYRKDAP